MHASSDQEDSAAGRVSGAIEDVDQRLKDWIGSLLPDKPVSLAAPTDQQSEALVGLYLLELNPSPPSAGGARHSALQIRLGYLITTTAERPEEAHSMLWRLAFAAMAAPEFDVEMAPLSGALWQAFGVLPRPSFMLRLPLRLERTGPQPLLVQSAIEMQSRPLVPLSGVLEGPGERPIANARVELPALRLASTTDHQGHFRFAAVPAGKAPWRFRVLARGREFVVAAEPGAGEQAPLIIRINPGDQ